MATAPTLKKRNKQAPEKAKRVVGPEELIAIETGVLEGKTLRQIGAELGIAHTTLFGHLQRTIRPAWREKTGSSIEELLARLRACYRHAWKKLTMAVWDKEVGRPDITKPGSSAWLAQAVDCLKEEAKLLGHYKPTTVHVDEDEFRMAGMTNEELDAKMMKRLMTKVNERRAAREAADRGEI